MHMIRTSSIILLPLLFAGLTGCNDRGQAQHPQPSASAGETGLDAAEESAAVPMEVTDRNNESQARANRESPQRTRPTSFTSADDTDKPKNDGDWPAFRGLHGNGVSTETGLPLEWSDSKNIVWKTKLPGPGASSPITFGEHIYVTCYSGYGLSAEDPGDKSQLKRHLVCLDREQGEILWNATLPSQEREFDYVNYINTHGYASSTPTADEMRVYVFFGAAGVAAYSHDGKLIWRKSCGGGLHEFGSAASPVLYKNLVIVQANIESQSLIAFDKTTGREVWRHSASLDPQKSRSTPCLVNVAGKTELVFDYRVGKLAAVDPDNGEFLWECASVEKYQNPTPVAHAGVVYTIGGSRMASVAIRAGGRGDVTETHQVWSLQRGSRVSSPVYYEGYLYWVREAEGIVACVDAKTGTIVYDERLMPRPGKIYASPIIADGKLYYVSRDAGTYVLPAKPEFKLLAHNMLESDKSIFNGSPAVSRGCLLLRSDQSLYCIGEK